MRKRWISLQQIIILIVAAIFLLTLGGILVLNKRDYNYLIEEQGKDMLELQSSKTKEHINNLFNNIQIATSFYAGHIQLDKLYQDEDLTRIADYTLSSAEKIMFDLPEISVIYYGDYRKRFCGYLIEDNGMMRFMLKDPTTQDKLIYYNGRNQSTGVYREFEHYDPTKRPWYTVSLKDPSRHWSDLFIAYDNSDALSVSALEPIIDQGEVVGVVSLDIKLRELSTFLIDDVKNISGIVYIINSQNEIIASSDGEDYVNMLSVNPPKANIEKATECSDIRIRESSNYIANNSLAYNDIFRITIGKEDYFGMKVALEEPSSLGLQIISLIPESDLVGPIKSTQAMRMWLISALFALATIIASFVLSKTTRSVHQVAEQAGQISETNFSILIDESYLPIKENHNLIEAFNKMLLRLQTAFEEIKASEEKFRSLVENSEDAIILFSPSGEILMANEQAARFFGHDRNFYIGRSIYGGMAKEADLTLWKTKCELVVSSATKVSFSYETYDVRQERKILSVQLIPQLDPHGGITNILCTQTDITELIQVREQVEYLLQSENERLEALVKAKTEELNTTMKELMDREKMASLGSLVSGVAHEINTPLGVAVSAASFLKDENTKIIKAINEGRLTKDLLAEYLDNTEESTRILLSNLDRASNLIASFKKISVNQSVETKMQFNFYEYLQSILLMLKHEYKNTGHNFQISCPRDLILTSYPGAYSQIFTNLIMNSLLHAFREIKAGEISIKAEMINSNREDAELLRIEYRDNGVGISEENLKHIYDPFFTTTRGSGNNSGSGLGLSIIYNLVTVTLQGRIECISKPGQGVLFIIEVPYNG